MALETPRELQLREAYARLQLLYDAATLLSSAQPLQLLDDLYRRLSQLLDIELYFHFAYAENHLQLIAYRGVSEDVVQALRRLEVGDAVCGSVAARRERIVLDNVQQRADAMTEEIRGLGVSAYVCHPLIADGTLIGTLSFGSRRRSRFSEQDLAMLQAICGHVAVALERDRVRRALKAREGRLSIALGAGHMGTFEWDLGANRIAGDDAFYHMLGLAPGSVSDADAFWALVHPDDVARLEQLNEAQLRDNNLEFLDSEFRVVLADGAERWIGARSRVIRDAGVPARISGVIFDITERKQGEEAQRLAHLAGQLGTFRWDVAANRVTFDDGLAAIYGIVGPKRTATLECWMSCVSAEDRARVREEIDALFARHAEVWQGEFRIVRPDGETRWIESRIHAAYFPDGAPRSCHGVNVDITPRKRAQEALDRSERRFREAFEHAPIGMVLSGIDGRFLYVNHAYCRIVGYEREELMRPDFDFRVLTHPDDRTASRREMDRLLRGEVPASFLEKRYVRKDGGTMWVRMSATVHRDAQGRPVQVVSLVEDITQRKHAEEALRETDRRKDDFLAALGHELRNPLAPIRNAMQVLRMRGDREPQVRWAAEVTERQVQQMTRLVDDLLDVSRINRGKLELRHEPLDLKDVIAHSVEMTAPLIEAHRHRLELRVPPLDAVVCGDAVRLTQALANLLSNAAKFTPAGGLIELFLAEDTGAEGLLIRVRDNGVGIRAGELRDIFEPFRQAESGTRPDPAGLGLGLSLAKRLVELHGGRLEAESQGPGRGSEFRVWLPRLHAEPVRAPRAAPAATDSIDQLRVVVVDDNRDVAESLAALLKLLGHDAVAVFSGREALDAVDRLRPHVVFCDIGLPDLSGHQVAEKLREMCHDAVRLVALTGFARDTEKAVQAGFDEWFLKPVDIDEIRLVLERSRAQVRRPLSVN